MSSPIPFGVIGTGWITTSFIQGAHASKQWQLQSVYSRTASTAHDFAALHHAPTTHTSLSSLAADPTITTVYIASPNSLHFSQASLLLRAKKHIILEKPLASNPAELTALFALARENAVFLLEAYRHLHESNFRALRDAIPRLGPVYGASLTYASFSSRYTHVLNGETPNIFSLEFSGGSLVDLAVYPISFAVALFGAPLASTYKPVLIRTGADGGGPILLKYKDFGVQINASKIYTSTAPSEIYGEKGTLVVNGVTDIERVTWVPADKKMGREELAGAKEELNLREEAVEFARIIREGDWGRAEELEAISRAVVEVTEGLRRENGLVFGCER